MAGTLGHQSSVPGRQFGQMCFTKAGLAIGTAPTGFNTTGTTTYTIDGVFKTFGGQVSRAFASPAPLDAAGVATEPAKPYTAQGVSQTVYYTVGVDVNGNFGVAQGEPNGPVTSPIGIGGYGSGNVPDLPRGWCPFGLIKVVTNGTTTFTPGTTALNAAGVTSTFYDLALIPSVGKP